MLSASLKTGTTTEYRGPAAVTSMSGRLPAAGNDERPEPPAQADPLPRPVGGVVRGQGSVQQFRRDLTIRDVRLGPLAEADEAGRVECVAEDPWSQRPLIRADALAGVER